jgi:hypothetical protein
MVNVRMAISPQVLCSVIEVNRNIVQQWLNECLVKDQISHWKFDGIRLAQIDCETFSFSSHGHVFSLYGNTRDLGS